MAKQRCIWCRNHLPLASRHLDKCPVFSVACFLHLCDIHIQLHQIWGGLGSQQFVTHTKLWNERFLTFENIASYLCNYSWLSCYVEPIIWTDIQRPWCKLVSWWSLKAPMCQSMCNTSDQRRQLVEIWHEQQQTKIPKQSRLLMCNWLKRASVLTKVFSRTCWVLCVNHRNKKHVLSFFMHKEWQATDPWLYNSLLSLWLFLCEDVFMVKCTTHTASTLKGWSHQWPIQAEPNWSASEPHKLVYLSLDILSS